MSISAPTDIANCELWLDAESGAYSDAGSTPCNVGDTIQQLSDLSGNSRHATQATSGNRPTFLKVEGVGAARVITSHYLDTSSFFGSGYNTAITVAVVMENRTTGFAIAASDGSGSGVRWDMQGGSNVEQSQRYTPNLSDNTHIINLSRQNNRVEVFRYNGSTKKFRIAGPDSDANSSEAATGNIGVTGILRVGQWASGGFGIIGLIRAVIVYSRSITDGETDDLVAWALAKFAAHSNGSLAAGAGNAVVACHGDSLTLGTGSTGGNTYPAQLATLLGGTYTVSNKGVSGQFMADMLYDRNSTVGEIDALWSSGATRNICVYFEGINEVQNGASGAQCYQRTKEYGLRRRYKGFEPITVTIAAAGTASAGAETARQDMNTLLRADFSVATADPYVFLANPGVNYARALVDMAARPEFDTQADTSNTTYYDADTLHWTNTTYGILAAHVKNAIDSTAVAGNIANVWLLRA